MANFGSEGSDAEDALLAALVEVHRRKQRRETAAVGGDARARIVAHFERRGQRLRGERLVTAELIDRLFGAAEVLPPRRSQQEIRIEGRAGSQAVGRLRVTNRSSARAGFELVVGDPVEGERHPELRFDPPRGDLEPGASLLVRVEAMLTGWQAGERATLPIECRWRDGCDRAWLVVSAQSASGQQR